jgi:methylmalonyl-CoA mutase N-terminal domain/subunit
VNEFQIDEERKIPIHASDPALEAAQIESLLHCRATRDEQTVRSALGRLENAAKGTENLMPYILEAVEAYATVGEISDAFRRVHGEYQEALSI